MAARRKGSRRWIGADRFRADVLRWARRIGVTPARVQVQPMRHKWASCSAAGRLTFSRDLLLQEARFRDVVVVHELLHLRIPNHGKLFRGFLGAYLPGWERVVAGRARRVCGGSRGRSELRGESG